MDTMWQKFPTLNPINAAGKRRIMALYDERAMKQIHSQWSDWMKEAKRKGSTKKNYVPRLLTLERKVIVRKATKTKRSARFVF